MTMMCCNKGTSWGFIMRVMLASCGTCIMTANGGNTTKLQQIYGELLKVNNGNYKGKTFDAPATNYLKDDWIVQVPNVWKGDVYKSEEDYAQAFVPKSPKIMDPKFVAPTCSSQSDCNFPATCKTPVYSKNVSLCVVPAYDILTKMYNAIILAEYQVDIVTLQPVDKIDFSLTDGDGVSVNEHIYVAEGGFKWMIIHALEVLAKKTVDSGNPIHVRMIQGHFIPAQWFSHFNMPFLETIIAELARNVPGHKMHVALGSSQSCNDPLRRCSNNMNQSSPELNLGWNHGKFILVDHKTLIEGGINLWQSMLSQNPVHDLSMQIQGPVVHGAIYYANALWDNLCQNLDKGLGRSNMYGFFNGSDALAGIKGTYIRKQKQFTVGQCPGQNTPPNSAESHEGTAVEAMYVSKLNNGILDEGADQSELARVVAIKNARKSVKIMQQALYFGLLKTLHPIVTSQGTVMDALAGAIVNGVEVSMVMSSYIYSDTAGYSSNVPHEYVRGQLEDKMVNDHGKSKEEAKALLTRHFHYGVLSLDGQTEADHHDKAWIVDDVLFSIGSHNIYPSAVQEFGLIVESETATKKLLDDLWVPKWAKSIKKLSGECDAEDAWWCWKGWNNCEWENTKKNCRKSCGLCK